MSASNFRNQRNNPYALDGLFVAFHRSAAGVAWRWRTELAIIALLAAALWRLTILFTLIWAGAVLGALVLALFALPVPGGSSPAGAWCVLTRHRLQRLCYEARLHTRAGRLPADPVDPPDQGRGTVLAAVPGRDLRRGLRGPHRRAARRLLRPRRAGHPQPPLVPAGDHRHHPPRHPRGQRIDHVAPPALRGALRPGPGSPDGRNLPPNAAATLARLDTATERGAA